MQEFYKRSGDAVLAEKLMRLGQPLAVWLTDADDVTTFHLMHFGEDGAYIDGKLQESLEWQTSFFTFADAKQAGFLLPIDDPVTPLQQEIALHETTIKGFEAALELANEKVTNRNREIRELSDLRDANNSDNRELSDLRDANNSDNRQLLEECDRKIEILGDNLDRARSEHWEQLRAIVQMLKPIKNNAFGSNSNDYTVALKLVIAVIQDNIARLDPNLE